MGYPEVYVEIENTLISLRENKTSLGKEQYLKNLQQVFEQLESIAKEEDDSWLLERIENLRLTVGKSFTTTKIKPVLAYLFLISLDKLFREKYGIRPFPSVVELSSGRDNGKYFAVVVHRYRKDLKKRRGNNLKARLRFYISEFIRVNDLVPGEGKERRAESLKYLVKVLGDSRDQTSSTPQSLGVVDTLNSVVDQLERLLSNGSNKNE